MSIPEPELTPALRNFLAQSGTDESWTEPAAQGLASCDFLVAEQMLGEPKSRFVRAGGVRLLRVTQWPMSSDDLSALFSRRPDLAGVRLVLTMFWFTFEELPPKRQYSAIRILVRLQPPAPVLLLSPDQASDSGQTPSPLSPQLRAELAELLGTEASGLATAFDLGPDGFGWIFKPGDAAKLSPRRQVALAALELPRATALLTGLLEAEAQISRSVLGTAIVKQATPANLAAPFEVPLAGNPESASERRGDGSPRASDTYDLGLIIALREEFDCAREILNFDEGFRDQGYYFYPFSVPGASIRGIALVLYDMGTTQTGVAATTLLDRHQVQVLALIGIAGALDGEFRLGDVVVASSVDQYLHRAMATPGAIAGSFDFDSGSAVWRAGRDVVAFANNFKYLAGGNGGYSGWRDRGRQRREVIGLPDDGKQARDRPDYFVAAVASGEIIDAAPAFSRWLSGHHRQCGAIEMEAGGVAHAVYQHGHTEMIIVRGISDFADDRKLELDAAAAPGAERGAWRRYAALNAADLLAAMVRSAGFPWPAPPDAA